MNIENLTPAQLRKAATLQERIQKLQKKLAQFSSEPAITAAKPAKTGKRKHKMSPAGRARIAAAQKARWAKIKGGKKG